MSLTLSNKDRYCIEVCKAKCCYTPSKKPCPNLTSDFKCGIYNKWENNTCGFTNNGKWRTAPIEYVVKNNLLPKEVLVQCCYAHPELLENLNGN